MSREKYKYLVQAMLLMVMLAVMTSPDAVFAVSGKITQIEIKGLTRIEDEELLGLINLRAGDEFDGSTLRDGIRRAFKKMIFLDIKVIAEPHDAGLRLEYIVKEVPVINKITIRGNIHFSSKQIREVLIFKKNEDFKAEYLDEAESTVREFYQRKGYPDTRVDIDVQAIDKESKVNIYLDIQEGEPEIVKSITVPDGTRHLVTLAPGNVLDRDELDRIIKKLRDHYNARNYLRPVVGPYEISDGDVNIPAEPGPRLEIKFINNVSIRTRLLEQEVNYLENEEVSDELTNEIVWRIKNLYISRGYYYAEAAAAIESSPDLIKVSFVIFEGDRVMLRNISIEGAAINSGQLKKILPLVENRPFNNNLVDDSRESLVNFYNALGYRGMKVLELKKDFRNEGQELDLVFYIDEGPRTIIKKVGITGNRTIDEERIRKAVKIKKGSPYNVVDIGDARYRVLSLYSQYGFMEAKVEVETAIDEEEAEITFQIEENKRTVTGKVIVRGNDKTKTKIIVREITLEEGGFYDSEQIVKIKQQLYKLGIFNEISIDMLEPSLEDEGKVVKDMLVSLKEGNAGSVEFIFGYGDYEEFRGALDIRYRNIGGYNRQAGFRAEMSSVKERYVLNFQEPWFLNQPDVPLKLFLVKEQTSSVDVETGDVFYNIDKLSFIAGVEKELIAGLKVGINYEYSFTDTTDVRPDVILSKEDTGTLGIGSISPTVFYDTRDNPFDPTRGSLHGLILKFASVAFLSETEFMKGSFQSAWFFPLHRKIVLAFSLRGGVAYSYEETEEMPLIERYFLGGRGTVRGYEHDRLGPKGADDTPTGGNVFGLTNVEFRFSLGKGIGLVTFIDAGNVWRTFDDVSSDLKYTAGAGLRYRTPVGPVRLDYGHKINRDPGQSAGEVHFSFGHAF